MSAASLATGRSYRIAGIPTSMWAAGIRIWLAMMLALYVAFWLQLDGASSAAVCVGIVSQQTRGATASKAFWRAVGTIIGVVASIVMAGAFNGQPVAFFVAVALWIGACTALSSLLDGQRAYGAVLSGYTVAVVAVANVDDPGNVFSTGINRGAAIMVGILAVLVVNDLSRSPEVFPDLRSKLSALRRDVLAHARAFASGGWPDAVETARLSGRIATLHPSIDALASEYPLGAMRSAATRRAVGAMLALLSDVRRPDVTPDMRQDILEARSDAIARALRDMDARSGGGAAPLLLPYRSRRNAAWSGLRAGVGIMLAAWLMAMCGWSQTSLVVVVIAAVLGIGATTPDPVAFSKGLPLMIACAAVVAGVTQFLVLDGSDAFPMLMLAMAPPVVGGGMLAASGRPIAAGLGTMTVIFLPTLLSLSNPQSYNPQTFLTVTLLMLIASVGILVISTTLFPVSAEQRLAWMLRSAKADLRKASSGRLNGRAAAGWLHRDADRLGQAGVLVARGHGNAGALAEMVRISGRTAAALNNPNRLARGNDGDGAGARLAPDERQRRSDPRGNRP